MIEMEVRGRRKGTPRKQWRDCMEDFGEKGPNERPQEMKMVSEE